MHDIIPGERMACIASCVPRGAVLADVGTDHGKLPVYLAQKGLISRAVAADINEMPLQKAVNNIKKYGVEAMVDTFLTDGLRGLEAFSPDCVVIAGMGGELICQILEESTVDLHGVMLILQPMTKEDTLRRYLCENGFRITDEHIVKEGKIYQIICAEYTGETAVLSESEYLIGRINIEKTSDLLVDLVERVEDRLITRMQGKLKAGLDTEEETICLGQLAEIKEKYYGDGK